MTGPQVTHGTENLLELLAGVARRASDGRLVLAAALGLMGVVAIALMAPDWWRWTFPLVSMASFGAWGIADRIVHEQPISGAGASRWTGALRTLCWGAASIGLLAALGSGLLFMAGALGTWIS